MNFSLKYANRGLQVINHQVLSSGFLNMKTNKSYFDSILKICKSKWMYWNNWLLYGVLFPDLPFTFSQSKVVCCSNSWRKNKNKRHLEMLLQWRRNRFHVKGKNRQIKIKNRKNRGDKQRFCWSLVWNSEIKLSLLTAWLTVSSYKLSSGKKVVVQLHTVYISP